MAWSFGDGFDLYASIADMYNGYWDTGGLTSNISLVAGRFTGSQAVSINNFAQLYMTKTSGVNDAVHHLVMGYKQTVAISGTNLGTYFQLVDGTTGQCCVVFRSDGAILLTSGTPGGTILATYAGAVTVANTWYAFEFEISINNSTGVFNVRKNGNTSNDFTATGLNTRVSSNNYANKLQIGCQGPNQSAPFDDLFWRSDASSVPWLGDIRCITRMPASDAAVQFSRTATGALTQTSGGGSNSIISNAIARFTQFTAGYSGTVTGVGIAVFTGNAGNLKCAIYADNAGAPGAVLASATTSVTPVVTGTNAFTFSPGVAVTKGTPYWIATVTDTNSGNWTSATSPSSTGATATSSYAVFPQNNPVSTPNQVPVQMSWTYNTAPGNWMAVTEPQQDATTSYVYDSTPGDADFYGVAAIASTPVATIAVTTRAYMEKSDAGTRTAAVQLKSGSATVASSTLVLTTSGWLWAWRTDITDPNTSAAWTAASVNNAQVGPKVIA